MKKEPERKLPPRRAQRLALALLLAFLMLPAQTFGDEEAWEATCRGAEKVRIPAGDRPDAETAKSLGGCESARLYYGFDIAPYPVKARQCAYLELERGDAPVFGGSSVLMMIYANGKGVKRNIDLAIRFACDLRTDAAPAEMEERIQHLLDLKKQREGKSFDLCDDITSGNMQGHCAGLQQRFQDARLKRIMERVLAKWDEKDKQAFQSLRASFEKFAKARVDNEVDLTGTGRGAFEIEEEMALSKDFVSGIEGLEKGRFPHYTHSDFVKADGALNAVYRKLQNQKEPAWGTVTPSGIKHVQRIWLTYREAWVAFGRQKYPRVTEDSWRTWLTRKRTTMLKSFLE